MFYNGIDVFRRAATQSQQAQITAVDWYCSDQFTATPSSAVSFVKEGAFLAFDQNYPRKGGTFTFDIKTQAQDAMILYVTGPPSRLGSDNKIWIQ